MKWVLEMKRLLLIVSLFFMFQAQVFSVESVCDLNLNSNNSYILILPYRPLELKSSNNEVVRVESVTNFDEDDSSILITTFKEGISYISFMQKTKEITYRFLVDDLSKEDISLIKLDKFIMPKTEVTRDNI